MDVEGRVDVDLTVGSELLLVGRHEFTETSYEVTICSNTLTWHGNKDGTATLHARNSTQGGDR